MLMSYPRVRSRLIVLALATALLAGPALAVEPVAAPAQSAPQLAPVLVDGHELFKVVGIAAYPARRRADEIAARIVSLARDPAFDSAAVQVAAEDDLIVILAGNVRVMAVLDQDAAAEGLATKIVARGIALRIREAIDDYRRERAGDYVLSSLLLIMVVGISVGALAWLLRWLARRLLALLEARYRAKVSTLEARSSGLLEAEQFWRLINGLVLGLWWLALLVAISVAADVSLQRLPWTRVVSRWFRELIESPLRTMLTAVVESLPDLVFLAILALVVRYVLRLVQAIFLGIAQGNLHIARLEPDTAMATYKLARYGIIAFALVVAYPYIPGSGSDAFKGISVFTGVLVSIGASSIIANTLAGYTLIFRKAFRVGDRVRIGAQAGRVEAIRQQVTVLVTPKNEQVVIPNSVILSTDVVNYSARAQSGQLILQSTVTIGYDAPWRQVEALLLQAADRTAGLLKSPPPFVLKRELGDFYVTYEINGYSNDADSMPRTYSDLHENILDLFNEHEVQIMSPHFEDQPAEPVLVRKERWFAPPASRGPGGAAPG